MAKYLAKVQTQMKKFKKVEVTQIPLEQNTKVNSFSKVASMPEPNITKGIFFEVMLGLSICARSDVILFWFMQPTPYTWDK